jgi:branched-subunit amino acid aminotransferase/4-amino-4-deoxychorismate lyase
MEGIIRARLLELHLATEKHLTPDDLDSADGLYLSNAVRGIVPVHSLNGGLAKTTALPFNPADIFKG